MNFTNRRRLKTIATYALGWTAAFVFLSIIRGIGATEDGALDIDFWTSTLYSFTMGPIFGAISGFAQIVTDEHLYKRTSAGKLIAIRLSISFIFLFLLIVISYLVVPPLMNVEIDFVDFIFDKGSFPVYFYILSIDIFMVALWQVNLLLGSNNLWKILTGKFYTPREEIRIFMFLDLHSSTEYAEKLGHVQYSKLIQDCFDDLGVVIESEAEIYQYVGDGVILTWRLENGLRKLNCLTAYYTFKDRLEKKQSYYQKKYNCIPFFKAGLNEGLITVTEVGKYKREIAYHGDTINTAARIQGKCNEFDQELLISENLKSKLSPTSYRFEPLGSIPLKGKEEKVKIYAVLQEI